MAFILKKPLRSSQVYCIPCDAVRDAKARCCGSKETIASCSVLDLLEALGETRAYRAADEFLFRSEPSYFAPTKR